MSTTIVMVGQNSDTHFSETLTTTAQTERIWEIWTDVSNWHSWDTGLQSALLIEPWSVGAKGEIMSDEGRRVSFKVVEYEKGKSYTIAMPLFLGKLYVKRFLSTKNGKTTFTHEVWMSGLSKWFFKKMGRRYRALLPGVLENINIQAMKNKDS